ncbi:radial spoke head protein 3 homolog A isoform X2 [Zootermopsis nevadensis]|uniref:radial spoke head protein 3 homolog A isoform X2 n=1 Tax=Zootermopsis nevadensis TaxID=136037 RepID=UPI000B8E26CD|nr:radial spoke head protein 3 homolog A isoform X2 [Zootermopsis nevadensis]
MPAVPLSVETNSNASTLTDDQEREFTVLHQDSEFTDVTDFAFTVLHEDSLKQNLSEGNDGTEEVGGKDESQNIKRKIYNTFNTSIGDHKILNRSNAYLLQQKLMNLSKSNSSLQDQGKSKNLGSVINNLKEQKNLSKSNSHLPYHEKYQLKKDISKSFNSLQRRNIDQGENNIEKEHRNYHRYCHISGRNYLNNNNNMTTLKQRPGFDREFTNFTDTGIQKNDAGARRRRNPTGPESHGNNNNNINGVKNNEKKTQFYAKNGYTNNIKMNEKNTVNSEDIRKPLFITTVKTGKFLDPPPELAILLGLNHNLNDSVASSANGSSNSLNTSVRDRHQQQVLLYSFSSQPRVLHQHYHRTKCDAAAKVTNSDERKICKEGTSDKDGSDDGPVRYGNLMFDRRVIRGSTYAQQPMPPRWNPYFGYAKLLTQTDGGETQVARQQEARRRAIARRRAQGQQTRTARYRLRTPPPVAGRRHETVQTEKYLEEILDRPPESEASSQTDLFLDRPETPGYLPAKVGLDVETQIYPGDLFDFDAEVQPVLEVLVGKTVEEAMTEVLEEEELMALRAQQRRFQELQRLQEEERTTREETDRRMEQGEVVITLQRETEQRVAEAVLTEGHLADLLPPVLEGLKEAGYVIDDVKIGVEEEVMPWLISEVKQEINQMFTSREVLTDIVREILETKAEIYRVMAEEDAKELGLDSEEEKTPKRLEENPGTEVETDKVIDERGRSK